MKFNFYLNKDAINLPKHQLSLADAANLDWMAELIWIDNRQDYGEIRQIGLVPMNQRLYVVVVVDKKTEGRIINLRKVNNREYKRYERETY